MKAHEGMEGNERADNLAKEFEVSRFKVQAQTGLWTVSGFISQAKHLNAVAWRMTSKIQGWRYRKNYKNLLPGMVGSIRGNYKNQTWLQNDAGNDVWAGLVGSLNTWIASGAKRTHRAAVKQAWRKRSPTYCGSAQCMRWRGIMLSK